MPDLDPFKIVYGYLENGEYTGEERAFLDPVTRDHYNMPFYTTDISPAFQPGYIPVWDGECWENREDHRGKIVYEIATKKKVDNPVDYIGAIKEGFTLLEPFDFAKWDGNKWVKDTDAENEYLSGLVMEEWVSRISETDRDLLRSTEDLIDVLREKEIISLSDLPATLSEKYTQKKNIRNQKPE